MSSLSGNHNDHPALAPSSEAIPASDMRLRELGYTPQFKRDMSFLGVIGISFWYELCLRTSLLNNAENITCSAIGILTGRGMHYAGKIQR